MLATGSPRGHVGVRQQSRNGGPRGRGGGGRVLRPGFGGGGGARRHRQQGVGEGRRGGHQQRRRGSEDAGGRTADGRGVRRGDRAVGGRGGHPPTADLRRGQEELRDQPQGGVHGGVHVGVAQCDGGQCGVQHEPAAGQAGHQGGERRAGASRVQQDRGIQRKCSQSQYSRLTAAVAAKCRRAMRGRAARRKAQGENRSHHFSSPPGKSGRS
mmetsp:Transcript_54356/g.168771  ORF Transcript_54356/g.168771 Transcript_54356/m.168771 type:complete len:212 (-) Transcript_54356:305-940(-)